MKRCIAVAVVAAALAAGVPAFAQTVPEIAYDANTDLISLPAYGEVAGVATNSKGDIYVYARTGHAVATLGDERTFYHGGSRLFQFDKTGKFVREIGQGTYSMNFAQQVRVDPQDNVWAVDSGSNMIMKFDSNGRMLRVFGRRRKRSPCAPGPACRRGVDRHPRVRRPRRPPAGGGGGAGGRQGLRASGLGQSLQPCLRRRLRHGRQRLRGRRLGHQQPRLEVRHGRQLHQVVGPDRVVAGPVPGAPRESPVDAAGNIYVADAGNRRIQVFDGEGNYKTEFSGIGTPMAICITGGPPQYLYSSNSNDPESSTTARSTRCA